MKSLKNVISQNNHVNKQIKRLSATRNAVRSKRNCLRGKTNGIRWTCQPKSKSTYHQRVGEPRLVPFASFASPPGSRNGRRRQGNGALRDNRSERKGRTFESQTLLSRTGGCGGIVGNWLSDFLSRQADKSGKVDESRGVRLRNSQENYGRVEFSWIPKL